VGILYGDVNSSNRTGLSLAEFDGVRGGFTASLEFDMFDLPVLPRSGWNASLRYFRADPAFGSDLDYKRLAGGAGLAHTFGRQTFHFNVQGGSSFDTDIPEFDLFTLGGFLRLSGLNRDELRGEHFGLGKFAWYTRLSKATSPYATTWHIGLQYEVGNTWFNDEITSADNVIHAGVIALIGTTFAGPLTVAYGRTDRGRDAFYVMLGVFDSFSN